MENGSERKAVSMMSKKRFFKIEEALLEITNDADIVANIMLSIMDIMKFDPSVQQLNGKMIEECGKKPISVMSKKRYFAIETHIQKTLELDAYSCAMATIMNIMNMDPNKKQYTPEQGLRNRVNAREQATILGLSVRNMQHIKAFKKLQSKSKSSDNNIVP
jgi:hypothetical protein